MKSEGKAKEMYDKRKKESLLIEIPKLSQKYGKIKDYLLKEIGRDEFSKK